jgi:hypothetical protein
MVALPFLWRKGEKKGLGIHFMHARALTYFPGVIYGFYPF